MDRMDWNVEDPFEALNRYIIFVDRLLLLRDSSSDIQTLELRWENVGNFKSDLGFKYDVSRHVATWIMAAVKHNMQELNLTLFLREMIKLPGCLFTSKSLTKLSVHGFGRELTSFGLPDVAVISPNIESICLTIEQTELNANNTGGDWIVGSQFPCLHYLKFVQIQGIQGCFNEFKFLQILLNKAIILEKVKLFCHKRDSPNRAIQNERRLLGKDCVPLQMKEFEDMLLAFRSTSSSVSISMQL
ncbi:hypothetical protein MKX03_030270 [Papaver bracteatum]|nr:hypothetical protein MKX03_030270 [Papaver bracteatum]